MKTRLIMSDTHCHAYSVFAETDEHGVNSRLKIILNEIKNAADHLHSVGGERVYHAGDFFHVRDSIKPSVLNPVLDVLSGLTASRLSMRVIPGNHDLSTRDSRWHTNATSAFREVGVNVVVKPTYFEDDNTLMIPWVDRVKDLQGILRDFSKRLKGKDADVILHAPLDGVLNGIPDHGLSPENLVGLDFKRLFFGHYHNYREFFGKVYSIGSLTHQNWGDVDSTSGYLLVDNDSVIHINDNAPKFVTFDIDATDDIDVLGNYVRVKIPQDKSHTRQSIEQELLDRGALFVLVAVIPQSKSERCDALTDQPSLSMESAVDFWVDAQNYDDKAAVKSVCQDILREVDRDFLDING